MLRDNGGGAIIFNDDDRYHFYLTIQVGNISLSKIMQNLSLRYQNDGVLITTAALWCLFRQTPWCNGLKTCWQDLEVCKFDWAHLVGPGTGRMQQGQVHRPWSGGTIR